MALTPIQRDVCRLLARVRTEGGERYLAGGAALGEAAGGTRVSRDLDLFHDTETAVAASADADRTLLTEHGFDVRTIRERPGYVEALVTRAGSTVRVDWARDSAYRFFPLVEHAELGLVLHPMDLATNKVLALVGRVEVRDWWDTMLCADRIQPLGYLAWAASGKDPGFSPAAILEHAARTARYSAAEVAELDFDGERPDASVLAREWRSHLDTARAIVAALPAEHAGTCVTSADDDAYRGGPETLAEALANGRLRFREGSIRGAFPRVRTP